MKKYNIIKLNGLMGFVVLLFIIGCLITGFLVFPGWVAMNIWNCVFDNILEVPKMELVHGILLWIIIAMSYWALTNNKPPVSLIDSESLEKRFICKIQNEKKEIFNASEEKESENKNEVLK